MTATFPRMLTLFRLLILASCALPALAADPAQAAAQGRVIVLGFDGADARTAIELMDKGQLPNLAALRERGTFAPLDTTNPAESPVSWAALNCGQNPAKTGVPGFVRRSWTADRTPFGDLGHLDGPKEVPVESFEGTPIPTWGKSSLGVALGLATAGLFLGIFLLLRMRIGLAVALALVLGAGGFIGGRSLRDYLPRTLPVWKNPLQSVPFWETAAAAGVPCVVLDAAQSFDRTPVDDARVLAGLGVPDARGMINSFFIYSSSENHLRRAPAGQSTDSGGSLFRIDERGGIFESSLPGPSNFWELDRIRAEREVILAKLDDQNVGYKASQLLNKQLDEVDKRLKEEQAKRVTVPVVLERKGDKVSVTIGHEVQELALGQWSDWYHLTYELNPLLKVRALTRAKLTSIQPDLELYVDALQYDPAHPPFWQPLSQPADFAEELAHACGPFETVGWACMNLPLKDNMIDSVSFMQDIEFTLKWREKMTLNAFGSDDWRVLMSCESTPDRVQHMMYQYYDPTHPMFSVEKAAQTMEFCGEQITLQDAIPASYRRMDFLVGEVVKNHLKPEDTLIVCSDHGFQSFRHQVHINNWLIDHGYLTLMEGAKSGKELNSYVDWSKTRAYALGLGMVFVNQQGREGKGIVPASEARALLESIRKDFLETSDPATGQKIGRGAYILGDIHQGKHLDREADMLLCFNEGYRVSWLTSGGAMSGEADGEGAFHALPTIMPNNKNWSGDHVTVDPELVRGIFFSNRKFAAPESGFSLLHVAPTVLSVLGVPVPAEYDLPPLVAR